MNLVCLSGRLVREPEIRETQNNNKVASFTLAVKRINGDTTDFISCVAWKQTADFVSKYVKKGHLVIVHGEINTRHYTNSNGTETYVTEINVQKLETCEKKDSTNENEDYVEKAKREERELIEKNLKQPKTQKVEIDIDSDDELPF